MDKITLLNIPVSTGTYTDFVNALISAAKEKRSEYTCVANVHMLIEAHRDASFYNVISNANFITPDGKPLSWAMQMLYGIKQDRVAGMDLLPDLLAEAQAQQLSVYFYGGSLSLLEHAKLYIRQRYPLLKVAGFKSPPFRKLSSEENEVIVGEINETAADIVFVVLGCPKQEKWMASMKDKIQSVMIGVGGALPVMIGMQKRAPRWMQHAGLEWAFRLFLEPRRLFRRYAVTNSMFVYLLLKQYVGIKLQKASIVPKPSSPTTV